MTVDSSVNLCLQPVSETLGEDLQTVVVLEYLLGCLHHRDQLLDQDEVGGSGKVLPDDGQPRRVHLGPLVRHPRPLECDEAPKHTFQHTLRSSWFEGFSL